MRPDPQHRKREIMSTQDFILQFVGEHWFLTFLALVFAYGLAALALKLVVRLFRMLTVMARGWPPEHLDADGDWKPEPEESP